MEGVKGEERGGNSRILANNSSNSGTVSSFSKRLDKLLSNNRYPFFLPFFFSFCNRYKNRCYEELCRSAHIFLATLFSCHKREVRWLLFDDCFLLIFLSSFLNNDDEDDDDSNDEGEEWDGDTSWHATLREEGTYLDTKIRWKGKVGLLVAVFVYAG